MVASIQPFPKPPVKDIWKLSCTCSRYWQCSYLSLSFVFLSLFLPSRGTTTFLISDHFILQIGADPNSTSDTGRSPLWRAAFNGHVEVPFLSILRLHLFVACREYAD